MSKIKRKPVIRHNTILVRLMIEQIHKTWTYRVRRGHKLKCGDEVVADTPAGPRIGYVIRVDKTPQDNDPNITYKFIERRTVAV